MPKPVYVHVASLRRSAGRPQNQWLGAFRAAHGLPVSRLAEAASTPAEAKLANEPLAAARLAIDR
jgi:hypothetical protein